MKINPTAIDQRQHNMLTRVCNITAALSTVLVDVENAIKSMDSDFKLVTQRENLLYILWAQDILRVIKILQLSPNALGSID